MNEEFTVFLSLGWAHILDFQAYDHLIFISSICIPYSFSQWRPLLIMVTGFTLGHTLSLALATIGYFRPVSELIEFLIPLTIASTAVSHLTRLSGRRVDPSKISFSWVYVWILLFGLVHGFGFSGYLSSLLGKEASILLPLVSFNLGIEIAQLFLVLVVLLAQQGIFLLFRPRRSSYVMVASGIVLGVSLSLIGKNWPF
jgi:hypothetical protein